MAQRATAERVQSDMKPPQFRNAVQRLRTIKAKKERVAGINGEISGIYDTVEGYKVNKKAAKIFLALDSLEPDEQQDIFRSLTGLIQAANWSIGDLVDQAEGAATGTIVAPKFRESDDGETGLEDEEQQDEIDQVADDVAKPAAAAEPTGTESKPETPAQRRARIKLAHSNGEAPAAQPAPEPYTGDDSDLNPE